MKQHGAIKAWTTRKMNKTSPPPCHGIFYSFCSPRTFFLNICCKENPKSMVKQILCRLLHTVFPSLKLGFLSGAYSTEYWNVFNCPARSKSNFLFEVDEPECFGRHTDSMLRMRYHIVWHMHQGKYSQKRPTWWTHGRKSWKSVTAKMSKHGNDVTIIVDEELKLDREQAHATQDQTRAFVARS